MRELEGMPTLCVLMDCFLFLFLLLPLQGDSVSKLPKGPSENGELSAPLELGSLVNGVS